MCACVFCVRARACVYGHVCACVFCVRARACVYGHVCECVCVRACVYGHVHCLYVYFWFDFLLFVSCCRC